MAERSRLRPTDAPTESPWRLMPNVPALPLAETLWYVVRRSNRNALARMRLQRQRAEPPLVDQRRFGLEPEAHHARLDQSWGVCRPRKPDA